MKKRIQKFNIYSYNLFFYWRLQTAEMNLNENVDSIEIIVSCGEDNNLEEYINDGWNIKQEYSEEKVCSWKTVAASKDCDLEKDKGCKIVQPDIIGEERIYLLEKK